MQTDKLIVTAAEMKEIEREAAENGLSYYQMMENAGTAAVEFILTKEQIQGKKVLVICGKGNNGGDGYVAARLLYNKGAEVQFIMADGEPKTVSAQ